MKPSPKSLSVGFCYDDSLDRVDGVSQYVKTLGAWLSSKGHRVVYLVGETKLKAWAGAPVYSLSKNLAVNFNGNRVKTPLLARQRSISQVLNSHQFDILHVQVPYSPLLASRVIRRLGSKTAVVGTFHIYPANSLAHHGSRLLSFVLQPTLARFSSVVSVSPAAADFSRRVFKLKTLPSSNVVNLVSFKTSGSKPRANHIVFLGRLVPRKGAMELLLAFNELKKKLPQATLTIGGDGPQRSKLEAYVRQKRLGSSVTFLGFVSEKDKPDLLVSAHIACFPSLGGESFGIVLIEAMAAGAGVVLGGNNPGYAHILGAQPETLFDPKDTKQLAAKLMLFLTDYRLKAKVHAAQANLVKSYSVETVGPKLLAVYKAAIAKTADSKP